MSTALKKPEYSEDIGAAICNVAAAMYESPDDENDENVGPFSLTDSLNHLVFEFSRIATAFEVFTGMRCHSCPEPLNSAAHAAEEAEAKNAATRESAEALVNAERP